MAEANGQAGPLDAIIELPRLERFAFVLCTLEVQSARNCSTFQGRGVESVLAARTAALRQLAAHKSDSMGTFEREIYSKAADLSASRHRVPA